MMIRVMRCRGLAAMAFKALRTQGKASPIMGTDGRSRVLGVAGASVLAPMAGVGVMPSSGDAVTTAVGVGAVVGMVTRMRIGVGLTLRLMVGTGVGVAVGSITAEPPSGPAPRP